MMLLQSEAFEYGKPIPRKFTVDGMDVSPPLSWSGVPATAQELALVCHDPNAPTNEPWIHWVIYKLPPDIGGLAENVPAADRLTSPDGAMQGRNSWSRGNTIGYRGPAPPPGHGVHHYHFRLYALDIRLPLRESADRKELDAAMRGHIVAEAELIGTYRR